jgi:hypothetical protein
MSRMAQPGQRLLLELPYSFAAEAQFLPQFFECAGRVLSETIPANDYSAKTFGKLTNQFVQGPCGQFLVEFLSEVRHDIRGWHLRQTNIGVSA